MPEVNPWELKPVVLGFSSCCFSLRNECAAAAAMLLFLLLLPAPEQKKPLCPWCGLSAAAGGPLSALTAISVSVLSPPRQLRAAVPPIAREPMLRRLQWAACSPRAPPSALSA